ncbi:exodeoxyribonuclease VII large subunit [Vagococcus vulneris]|uniref:Exodeoxyribonuclease 7 large subunit n=1 Tax=Vagococcus vulneris TaxID=1977869 RepID=A0A429ZWB6_9ENTE|nr:exodeoxyribonuclease VII large subunit [Vagococcus vulneris]RST98051.1 exodeoxyribonuclease VII large subunit [Vagococcus vulneris]
MKQADYLTVTALTKYLKRKFDADPYLERVFLTGEISNFRYRPNAHQYFSLKDDKAKLSAVMFKQAAGQLKFKPEEGMKVLVVGRVSLYEASGNYQIYVEHMEPDGKGALYQALEQRKAELLKEGLFNPDFKQSLPKFPKKIGIVTSPSGAVIRDIITTVRRRYPIVQLVLYPTVVQGDQAAADIVKQIKRADESSEFDTLIVGRGGGSIEDLWPFNEEAVVRAIFEAHTPIISSVGHETDVTLSDLAADVRAATPTAAAELAVPVLTEELVKISDRKRRLLQVMTREIQKKRAVLDRLNASFIFRQPQRLYEPYALKVDNLKKELEKQLTQKITLDKQGYTNLNQQLHLNSPAHRLNQAVQTVEYLNQRLINGMNKYMTMQQDRFSDATNQLDILSPLRTITRGYSLVKKENQIIRSVETLKPDDEIYLVLKDGEARATVRTIEKKEMVNIDGE